MAVTWYNTSGQPADSVGSDGDWARDATAKIDYGPKGSTTAGSWAQTARALQGVQGAGMLASVGAPASNYGVNGNGCTDTATGNTYYKSNNAWTQQGNILGPQGVAGPSSLLSQSSGHGTTVSTSATLSSTPTALTYPGQNFSPVISFGYQNAILGGIFANNTSSAMTFALVDTTTSQTVYSTSIAANSIQTLGPFSATAYPMISGHQFQWQVTGSGAATQSYVTPFYLYPAASPSYNVSSLPFCGRSSTSTTYGGTYNALYLGAYQTSYTFQCKKAVSLYGVTVYNQTNASITVGFANYTANNFLWNLGTTPANSVSTFGPYNIGAYAFTSGSQYYWSAAGSGTGACFVDSQVVYSAA